MPLISAKISEELLDKIESKENDTDKSKSQIIRESIRKYVTDEEEKLNNEHLEDLKSLKEEMNQMKTKIKDIENNNQNNSQNSEYDHPNNNNDLVSRGSNLDNTDRKIIYYVSNGSHSLSTLADKIGVSRSTAYRRMRNLEEKGLLKKVSDMPDYTKLDLDFTVLSLDVETKSLNDCVTYLNGREEVNLIIETLGDHDVVSLIINDMKNPKENVKEIINQMEEKNIKIKDFDVSTGRSCVKFDFTPSIPDGCREND